MSAIPADDDRGESWGKAPALVTNLSRLDESLYLGHTPYMVDYWFEHKLNFKQMISRLVAPPRLAEFLEVSGRASLRYNEVMKVASGEQAEALIKPAYEALKAQCGAGDWGTLYELMDGWYGAVDMIKAQRDARLEDAFSEQQGWFRVVEPLERVFGVPEEQLDGAALRGLFLPQLIIFFLRLLHFYDGALQGQAVDEFEAAGFSQERKQREKASAQSVKRLWARLATGDLDIAEGGEKEKGGEQKEAAARIPKPFEEKFLKENLADAVDQLELAWGDNEGRFSELWRGAEEGLRTAWAGDARDLILHAKNSRLLPSLMYCPELHPGDLAAHGGEPLLALLARALRMDKEDFQEDEGFVGLLRQYLTSIGQLEILATVLMMRRIAIAIFCQILVRTALHLPLPEEVAPQDPVTSPTSPSPSSSSSSSSSPASSRSGSQSVKPTPPVGSKFAKPPTVRSPFPQSSSPSSSSTSSTSKAAGACNRCGKPASLSCSKCKAKGLLVLYCSPECQRVDWASHKSGCGSQPIPSPSPSPSLAMVSEGLDGLD